MRRLSIIIALVIMPVICRGSDWTVSLRVVLNVTVSQDPKIQPRPFVFVSENLRANVSLGYYWTGEGDENSRQSLALPAEWWRGIQFEVRDDSGASLPVRSELVQADPTTAVAPNSRVTAIFDLGVFSAGNYTMAVRYGTDLPVETRADKTWFAVRRGDEDTVTRRTYLHHKIASRNTTDQDRRGALRELAGLEPLNADVRERLADVAAMDGDFDAARELYAQAVKIVETNKANWKGRNEVGVDFDSYLNRLRAVQQVTTKYRPADVRINIEWNIHEKQYHIIDRRTGQRKQIIK